MEREIKFKAPKGCVPEGKSEGDTFDAVCTFRVEQNGEVCLTMLGDCDMDYDERPKMGHKQDYNGYARSMQDMVGKEQT